jgi:hypothetical protein
VKNQGSHSVVNVSAFAKKPVQVRPDQGFRSDRIESAFLDETLSTQALRSGFLLETFGATGLVTERGTYSIISDPRVRLRSFPRSKRHNDCFVAVGEDFVELVGFIEAVTPTEVLS